MLITTRLHPGNMRLFAILLLMLVHPVWAETNKPNILIIWGDDVGMWNISAYHRGMMGGTTPNIDRIADQGMIFMDHYAQASCTAGRAAFLLGQYPMRTGLSTVGLPGAKEGIQDSDPTLAQMLKPSGFWLNRDLRTTEELFKSSSLDSLPA